MTLHDTWVAVQPLLQPAMARSPDPQAKVLLSRLMAREDTLWAIRENGNTIAAVVTTIHADMRCLIWLVGGSRLKEWAATFMETLSAWARDLGCIAIWGTGRGGWHRIVPLFGGERIEDHNGEPAWERKL